MHYTVNEVELPADDDGYLIEANFGDGVSDEIARVEGISLTDQHWELIKFLRDHFKEHGQTPNFRNLVKEFGAINPIADSKYLYDLFPMGPAKQAVKIAGLPQPYGKGGY